METETFGAKRFTGIDAFCGERFWDDSVLESEVIPAFSQCFLHTVLVWIPCLFLYIAAPIISAQVYIEKAQPLPWTRLILAKLVLTIVCLCDALFLVLLCFYDSLFGDLPRPVDFVYPLMLATAMCIMAVFIWACRTYGYVTSGGLFLTWLLFAICGTPELYYWIQAGSHPEKFAMGNIPRYIAFVVWYVCVVTQTVLFAFADKPHDGYVKIGDQEVENPSPETFSSFLNRQVMWWFNGICAKGMQKPLEVSDLYSLNPDDQSAILVPKWGKIWSQSMNGWITLKDDRFSLDSHTHCIEKFKPIKSQVSIGRLNQMIAPIA